MTRQGSSYRIGLLELREPKARVKQARGDAFSLKDFHAIVLSRGSMPLWILERTIRENAGRPQPQEGTPRPLAPTNHSVHDGFQ